MKQTKLILTAAAFVLGIGSAFATKMIGDTQEFFYLDGSGQPTTQVDSPDCTLDPTHNCAQLWNVDANGNRTSPAAAPIKGIPNE